MPTMIEAVNTSTHDAPDMDKMLNTTAKMFASTSRVVEREDALQLLQMIVTRRGH